MSFEDTNTEEINTDELLEQIEAPAPERAMGGGEPPAAAAPADPADWRQGFDWSFDAKGQKVAVDSADKARTWLSQGYAFSQNQAALNAERAQIQRQRQESEAKYKGFDRYAEVDDYARKNPQWWDHVNSQFQSRGQPQLDPNLAPIINPLLERLQGMEGFVQTLQQREQQQEIQRQDQELESEIESIRKKHPTIDLNALDETGKSLESRVLRHGTENGIHSFRAAFRDYFHDKLMEETKAQTLTQQNVGQKQAVKAGILGTTPAPTKGLKPASSRRSSYDDLAAEALKELGIG